MLFTCPVCGWERMRNPPTNHEICPCCGTQFGYTDASVTHEDLRLKWVHKGAKWHSSSWRPGPSDFNASAQLARLETREKYAREELITLLQGWGWTDLQEVSPQVLRKRMQECIKGWNNWQTHLEQEAGSAL